MGGREIGACRKPRRLIRVASTVKDMSKPPKKLKPVAGKLAAPPKIDKAKAPFITRAEARRRAERHVINQMFKGARVRDGVKSGLHAYNVRQEDTWVVYKNCPAPALRSSDIVVICKRSGRVLYEGSARDEG